MLGEPAHTVDPILQLLAVQISVQQFVLNQLEQFLERQPGGLSQRIAMDDGEDALEALPYVALGRVLRDILCQIFQNGPEDEARRLGHAPDNKPFHNS